MQKAPPPRHKYYSLLSRRAACASPDHNNIDIRWYQFPSIHFLYQPFPGHCRSLQSAIWCVFVLCGKVHGENLHLYRENVQTPHSQFDPLTVRQQCWPSHQNLDKLNSNNTYFISTQKVQLYKVKEPGKGFLSHVKVVVYLKNIVDIVENVVFWT